MPHLYIIIIKFCKCLFFPEWKTCLRKNLGLCREAIDRGLYFCKKIQSTMSTENNFMFVLESSLFDMATSGLAEGAMYAAVFQTGRQKFVRFLESGVFNGFFENRGNYFI